MRKYTVSLISLLFIVGVMFTNVYGATGTTPLPSTTPPSSPTRVQPRNNQNSPPANSVTPTQANEDEFIPSTYAHVSVENFGANVFNFIFPIALLISVAMVVVAGYSYMTSAGQPDKVQEASKKLTSAVTGAIFIILSLVILKVIINTLLLDVTI